MVIMDRSNRNNSTKKITCTVSEFDRRTNTGMSNCTCNSDGSSRSIYDSKSITRNRRDRDDETDGGINVNSRRKHRNGTNVCEVSESIFSIVSIGVYGNSSGYSAKNVTEHFF